jgi:hypothetical protein
MKQSGKSYQAVRTTPKKQPSRPIKQGFAGPNGPVGPKTEPSAQAAPKRADALRPSSPKKGPAKMWPQQVF